MNLNLDFRFKYMMTASKNENEIENNCYHLVTVTEMIIAKPICNKTRLLPAFCQRRQILELSGRRVPQKGTTLISGETKHAVARPSQETEIFSFDIRPLAPRGSGARAVEYGVKGVICEKRPVPWVEGGYDEVVAGRVCWALAHD